MKSASHYICREPRTPEELLDIFRLRRRVFVESGLDVFLTKAGAHYDVDIDCYDLRATHFGLYQCEKNGCKLVGSIRAVGPVETNSAGWVRSLTENMPRLRREIAKIPSRPLPLMKYTLCHQLLAGLDTKCRRQGKTLFEIGRFVMEPSHRAVFLSRALVEAVIAFTQSCNGSMIFACSAAHRLIYQMYLNWPLSLTPEFRFKGNSVTLIFWDMSLLPIALHEKMTMVADQYRTGKELHFYPDVKIPAVR